MRKPGLKTERNSRRWIGRPRLHAQVWLVLLVILPYFLACATSSAQRNAKYVLVLSSGRGHLSIDQMEASLRAHVPWPVNFSDTDLESPQLDAEAYRKILAEQLRHGFAADKPDLVVAVMDPSLQFAVEYHDKVFPGVPIVFMSVSSPEAKRKMWRWPGVTGVASPVGIRETIDLALRLHPDTNAIAVITNVSWRENEYFAAVHDELVRYRDKVKELDLVGPPSEKLLERVAALPPHTVALFQLWPVESDSAAFGVTDVLSAAARHLPTYCIFSGLCLGHGGIGGVYDDPQNDAFLAGEVAAQVLSGERPENISVVQNSNLQVQVDWRQLRRWHIPESALPPGTAILFKPPSFWERDRKYIVPSIGVIVAQALLIVGLLWQRRRKRKAEAVLRESEKRFRLMADTTPSLIWMCDARGEVTYLNARRLGFTDPEPSAGYGDTWTDYVHTDDLRGVLESLSQALKNQQSFSQEYRLRRGDGVYRWMFDVASPRINGDGSFAGFIGSAIDVTAQKLAQQALEKIGGQLIEAQEKERSRIARDLHDDVCQRLVLLSMELEEANYASNLSPTGAKGNLAEIRKHCTEIVGDLRSLSHQLHSSTLDYLGIVAALRGLCQEIAKQHKVTVEFTDSNVPQHLSKDASLCLFRVAQEALHNAVKYSGAKQFKVDISGIAEEIQLTVSDEGIGFDKNDIKSRNGLGLVSMQERINLVRGRLRIESTPGTGTRILAAVPIVLEDEDSFDEDITGGLAHSGQTK